MTMESKIQPILCCIGESVAGRPTQFLMERAFAARHSDWRVITVEIDPEELQTALDGMRAMRFKALRIFPEFQELAAKHLIDESVSPFGTITSALWQGDQWTCWDNQGFGLIDLIAGCVAPAKVLVWLHGESRLTHSFASAMRAAEFAAGHLLWSEGKGEQTLSLESVEQSLNEALAMESGVTHLAVIGESLVLQLELIGRLNARADTQLILAANELLTRQQANDVWTSGRVKILSEVDQLVAAEAYDFRRWSGQAADVDMLRDAYEEYADF